MRRVLIISPHFPPINAPDHQRVRMALPYLNQFGWKATVLTVRADAVEGFLDPFQEKTLPVGLRVIRVGAVSRRLMRLVGVGSLAFRAGRNLRRAGDELLSKERFDLAFFSTSLFPFMAIGPEWRRQFGIPYVLDFQDPWVSDYFSRHPERRPPGGRLKYGFSQWLARRNEPRTVRDSAQIVCVSAAYAESFLRRYPDVPSDRFTTLPFGAPEADFDTLNDLSVRQSVFDAQDGREHWTYIGRGGQDMEFAVRAFFTALRRYLDEHPERRQRLRIHFVGTDYAPWARARKTIEPVARECGVNEVVSEQTGRLPYFETLRCLQDAGALFVPGSDDPGYTASKLYPYVLARKPLLAVFHKQSDVVRMLRETGAGTVVTFESGQPMETVAQEIYEQWFSRGGPTVPATNWAAFEQYTAKAMTRRLCEVFDRAVLQCKADKAADMSP